MGLFTRLFGGRSLIDVMRLDIFMDYQPLVGRGSAAVQWVPMSSNDPNLRPFLICLLYARILSVHAETRAQLFWVIDELSKINVRDEGRTGFPFKDWSIHIGYGAPPQFIWPWDLYDSPSILKSPKVYEAIMQASVDHNGRSLFGLNFKMAWGQERILAPSSPLIAINSFSQTADQEGQYELALFLWQINEYYRSPDQISIGQEHLALAAATNAIRSGKLRVP